MAVCDPGVKKAAAAGESRASSTAPGDRSLTLAEVLALPYEVAGLPQIARHCSPLVIGDERRAFGLLKSQEWIYNKFHQSPRLCSGDCVFSGESG